MGTKAKAEAREGVSAVEFIKAVGSWFHELDALPG